MPDVSHQLQAGERATVTATFTGLQVHIVVMPWLPAVGWYKGIRKLMVNASS
jgi:hypothetical protein